MRELKLIMARGADQGYFPFPDKSLFIADKLDDKEVARWEFERAGLKLNYVGVSRYLGAYLGHREELEAWVRPKLGAWSHKVFTLAKITNKYPQSACAGLGVQSRSSIST